jgi:hypothetical protein
MSEDQQFKKNTPGWLRGAANQGQHHYCISWMASQVKKVWKICFSQSELFITVLGNETWG